MKFSFSLTIALVAISVIVAFLSNLGNNDAVLAPLLFSFGYPPRELFAGEVWRLLTPIFIHFGPLHLLFNMMWLWDLGGLVEGKKSTWFLGLFVVIVGIASNALQYVLAGPYFGGMSGVVYGLLGYVWMQGRYNPRFDFALHKHIVIMMLAWFVLGWTGLLGPIANWAHTGGLVLGTAWGFLTSGRRWRRR